MRRAALALLLAACSPWSVVQRAEPNPLAGSPLVSVLPLDWSVVQIDGNTEQGWDENNDADMKREWVVDKKLSVDEFHNGLRSEASGRLKLAPGAAPFTIRSTVMSLKTGGIRPMILVFKGQLLDSAGTVLEEISSEVKEGRGGYHVGQFRERLTNASRAGGANIGQYFAERASR
jgi:hypothetical protein